METNINYLIENIVELDLISEAIKKGCKSQKLKQKYLESSQFQKDCQSVIIGIKEDQLSELDLPTLQGVLDGVKKIRVTFPEIVQLNQAMDVPSIIRKLGTALGIKNAKKLNYDILWSQIKEIISRSDYKPNEQTQQIVDNEIKTKLFQDKSFSFIIERFQEVEDGTKKQKKPKQKKTNQTEATITIHQSQNAVSSTDNSNQSNVKSNDTETIEMVKQDEQITTNSNITNNNSQKKSKKGGQLQSSDQPSECKQEEFSSKKAKKNSRTTQSGQKDTKQENTMQLETIQQSNDKIDETKNQSTKIEEEKYAEPENLQVKGSELIQKYSELSNKYNPQEVKIYLQELDNLLPKYAESNMAIQLGEKNQHQPKSIKKKDKQILEKLREIYTVCKWAMDCESHISSSAKLKFEDLELLNNTGETLGKLMPTNWPIKSLLQELIVEYQQAVNSFNPLIKKVSFKMQEKEPVYSQFDKNRQLKLDLNQAKNEYNTILHSSSLILQKFDLSDLQSQIEKKFEACEQYQRERKALISQDLVRNVADNYNATQIENLLIDITQKYFSLDFYIESEQEQLLYIEWLFSTTCFIRRIKQGSRDEWCELQNCSFIFPYADQEMVKIINSELQFHNDVEDFMYSIKEKNKNEIKNMARIAMNYRIEMEQLTYLHSVNQLINEKQKFFYSEMMCFMETENESKKPLSYWTNLEQQLNSQIPIQLEEVKWVQQVISQGQLLEKDFKELSIKKQSNESQAILLKKIYEYRMQYFQISKAEKLMEQLKQQKEKSQTNKQYNTEETTIIEEEHNCKSKEHFEKQLLSIERKLKNLYSELLTFTDYINLEKQLQSAYKFASEQNIAYNEVDKKNLEIQIFINKVDAMQKYINNKDSYYNNQSSTYYVTFKELKMYYNYSLEQIGTIYENQCKSCIQFLEGLLKRVHQTISDIKAEINQENLIKYSSLDCVDLSEHVSDRQKELAQRQITESAPSNKSGSTSILADSNQYDPTQVKKREANTVKIQQYRTKFITKLSKVLEDNPNWNISFNTSLEVSKKMADKLYKETENNEKTIEFGEKIIEVMQKLHNLNNISRFVMKENFPWNYILTLRNKSNNILSIMNEETEGENQSNQTTSWYNGPRLTGETSIPLPQEDKVIRKKAKINVREQVNMLIKQDNESLNNNNTFTETETPANQTQTQETTKIQQSEINNVRKASSSSLMNVETQNTDLYQSEMQQEQEFDQQDNTQLTETQYQQIPPPSSKPNEISKYTSNMQQLKVPALNKLHTIQQQGDKFYNQSKSQQQFYQQKKQQSLHPTSNTNNNGQLQQHLTYQQQKKNNYPIEQMQADDNDSYTSKLEDEHDVFYYDPDSKLLRIYFGELYNKESNLQQISILTTMPYHKVTKMPEYSGFGNNLRNKMEIKQYYMVQQFDQYLGAILQSSKRYVINYGWLESELIHHHEALRRFSVKLRNADQVALVQWNKDCKLYMLHRSNLQDRWIRKLKIEIGRKHKYDSNMLFISIFKVYRVDNQSLPKLVPEIVEKLVDKQNKIDYQNQNQKTYGKQLLTIPANSTNNNMMNNDVKANQNYYKKSAPAKSYLEELINPTNISKEIEKIGGKVSQYKGNYDGSNTYQYGNNYRNRSNNYSNHYQEQKQNRSGHFFSVAKDNYNRNNSLNNNYYNKLGNQNNNYYGNKQYSKTPFAKDSGKFSQRKFSVQKFTQFQDSNDYGSGFDYNNNNTNNYQTYNNQNNYSYTNSFNSNQQNKNYNQPSYAIAKKQIQTVQNITQPDLNSSFEQDSKSIDFANTTLDQQTQQLIQKYSTKKPHPKQLLSDDIKPLQAQPYYNTYQQNSTMQQKSYQPQQQQQYNQHYQQQQPQQQINIQYPQQQVQQQDNGNNNNDMYSSKFYQQRNNRQTGNLQKILSDLNKTISKLSSNDTMQTQQGAFSNQSSTQQVPSLASLQYFTPIANSITPLLNQIQQQQQQIIQMQVALEKTNTNNNNNSIDFSYQPNQQQQVQQTFNSALQNGNKKRKNQKKRLLKMKKLMDQNQQLQQSQITNNNQQIEMQQQGDTDNDSFMESGQIQEQQSQSQPINVVQNFQFKDTTNSFKNNSQPQQQYSNFMAPNNKKVQKFQEKQDQKTFQQKQQSYDNQNYRQQPYKQVNENELSVFQINQQRAKKIIGGPSTNGTNYFNNSNKNSNLIQNVYNYKYEPKIKIEEMDNENVIPLSLQNLNKNLISQTNNKSAQPQQQQAQNDNRVAFGDATNKSWYNSGYNYNRTKEADLSSFEEKPSMSVMKQSNFYYSTSMSNNNNSRMSNF